MLLPQKECTCGFESHQGYMEYTLSEPPKGYTWEVSENDDPSFTDGKTLTLTLKKDGRVVERRGVFVPTKRENEAAGFVKGMENSIRMSLN